MSLLKRGPDAVSLVSICLFFFACFGIITSSQAYPP